MMQQCKALLAKARTRIQELVEREAMPERITQALQQAVDTEQKLRDEIIELRQQLAIACPNGYGSSGRAAATAAGAEGTNAAAGGRGLKRVRRTKPQIAADSASAAAAAKAGQTDVAGASDALQEMLDEEKQRAHAPIAAEGEEKQEAQGAAADSGARPLIPLRSTSTAPLPKRRGRPSNASKAAAAAAAAAVAARTLTAAIADGDGKEDGTVLSEDEPIAKRVRRTESDAAAAAAASAVVPSAATGQLSPEDEEFHDALFADLAEEQPASVSLAGDNASTAGTIVPSASLVPVLVPSVSASYPPPVPRDEQSLLAEAVAAEWLERLDALSPGQETEEEQPTRLQETPLHLLLPLLCSRMHVAGASAAGAAGKSSSSFCRNKVPGVLLSVFQTLLRGITTHEGRGAGHFAARKFVEPDLAALTSAQSAQVHRAAVQLHRWVRLLSIACAPRSRHHHHRRRRSHALGLTSLSSSSSEDSDSDASSSDDEEDRLILFSMPGSQSCACDSAVDFVVEMQRMAYEMLVSPRPSSSGEEHTRPHPRSYGMMTPADVSVECGMLSFLALSAPPVAPASASSDSSMPTATTTTMAAPLSLLELLQNVAVERPSAPLHLFEHALAICPELRALCLEGSATIAAAGSPCPHHGEHHASARMASPFGNKLLPAPRCCPSCALAVPPSLLLWRALLSDLLHPFPDDMLRVHLPYISGGLHLPSPPSAVDEPDAAAQAEADAADGSAADTTSAVVQPNLTLADACTLLLHRVSVLAIDVQDHSKRSNALHLLRSCMTELQVLFVSLGNEQALQLLHGVLLPLHHQQQQAAAANGDDKTAHFLAHVWRQLIGQIALELEHRLHDAL
jgi:hypothetical protein